MVILLFVIAAYNYRYNLSAMANKLSYFQMQIRTESSVEYSLSGHDLMGIEHSFQSIQISDQVISSFIQQLQKHEQQSNNKECKLYSSRSQSYILVKDDENEDKKKYLSMKNNKRNYISLNKVNHSIMTKVMSYQRCLNLAKNDVYNRAYGAMFGFVIGDALGAHVVNLPITEKQINQALPMNGGGVMNLLSGQCTDQWQICLALSQALIDCKGRYDSNKVAEKYLEWLDSFPTDLPVLFGIAFSEIKKNRNKSGVVDYASLGSQLVRDSRKNSKQQSNLGLVRLIPLVIWTLNLEEYLFNQIVKQQMKLITPNVFVQQTALVYANILRCILLTGDHMLAFHEASQYIYNFGSEKIIDLWSYIEERSQPLMTTANSQNLKFPFIYAVNELLQIQKKGKDLKKQFVQSAVRVLQKGFNTDTNCSIVLGLIGAIVGYNNIPSYFRSKILNSSPQHSKKSRKRNYHSKRVVEIVEDLLNEGPVQMEDCNF